MRRVALIFLLIILLPVQSIWAAAANACQQGCSSDRSHFGSHSHHEHHFADDSTQVTAQEPGGPADSSGGATPFGDGSGDHGHGVTAALIETRAEAISSGPGYARPPYRRSVADHFPENLLRPPLAPLA